MNEIFIATYPFGLCGDNPVRLLEETGWKIRYNSLGRRLKRGEVGDMIGEAHGVIAGTEPYTKEVIESAKNLKVISRVGVGLDSVDFQACKDNGVILTYTPEAPAEGVADLAVAQIINLLRGILVSDTSVREKRWNRYMGSLLSEKNIGVLGVGRIGGRVIKRLKSFGVNPIYACDISNNPQIDGVEWVDKESLFSICDVVTIHVPMNKNNYHCVGHKEMNSMKTGSFIVNTSRGPIIDEKSLTSLIQNKHLGGVALDVFEEEPYDGPLIEYDNVILTPHIGASAHHSRYLMELGAAENCILVLQGKEPINKVTDKDVK